MPIQVAVVGGGLLLVLLVALSISYFRSVTGSSADSSAAEEVVDMSIEVIDEVVGQTYSGADQVIAHHRGQDDQGESQGVSTDSVRIELTAGEGGAELEYGPWVFEVKQNGQTIGQRAHGLKYGFERDQIELPVEPHVVEAVVTGGPDREPLAGATVEARADAGDWTDRKSTDPEGRVEFKIPRSASAISFTATYEGLPTVESEQRIEQATQKGVTLPIAAETGTMTVETTVGDRPWPEVDIRITPVSEDAKAYTDEGTVTTKSGGRRTVEGLPTGEYEVSAQPQIESVDTTAAVERVTVEDDSTVEVGLPIGISYTMSTAQRERISELEDRIEGLASSSNHDVAIPQYYGTVLTSVLELVEDVESSPERAAGAGVSPDATVEALLDATEAGFEAVFDAMSDRRVVSLFKTCEPMEPAQVDWNGDATLDVFLDRVNEGSDHETRALRDRLAEIDDFLDQRWSEVNESAPVRKLHDRLGEVVREVDADTELAVVARTYVGFCLLDAIEELFEHDALVARLNGRTL
jgi:hypothetical protein